MLPTHTALLGGVGLGLAGAGIVHAIGTHRKKARNRALLARIRPGGDARHGMQDTPLNSLASLPQRIIAFAAQMDGMDRMNGARRRRSPVTSQSLFFDDRPRNGEGQFSPEQAAGADPASMLKAYGPPPQGQPSPAAQLAARLRARGFQQPAASDAP